MFHLPFSAQRACHRKQKAFTLIELMVVVLLIGIMTAVILPEMKGTYEDALLRSNSRTFIEVCNLASSRAVSFQRAHRLRLNPATGKYVVEKRTRTRDGEAFVPLRDVAGAEGTLDTRIAIAFHNPDAGAPAADAEAVDGAPNEKDETIIFYPDGTADAKEVLLQDRQGFRLLLQINPTTARVRVAEVAAENAAAPEAGGVP